MRMKIFTITSLFRKLPYRFHLIVLSYYKSVKKTRRQKKVNTTPLRLVIYLFLITHTLI